MNIYIEKEVVAKVENYIRLRYFGKVCFEVGKFIESVANQIHSDITESSSRNAKEAIDFLINRKLIPRPLGYKLHAIRELRNVEAHDLSYSISFADVRMAVDTLNETIEWLHQGKLALEWQSIVGDFDKGERSLLSVTDTDGAQLDMQKMAILVLFTALHSALQLKIESLNLGSNRLDFFSAVQTLVDYGIDVRSAAWRELTHLRNHITHPSSKDRITQRDFEWVRTILPELRNILDILCPLNPEQVGHPEYPQVSLDSLINSR